jgi:hypothetical protein
MKFKRDKIRKESFLNATYLNYMPNSRGPLKNNEDSCGRIYSFPWSTLQCSNANNTWRDPRLHLDLGSWHNPLVCDAKDRSNSHDVWYTHYSHIGPRQSFYISVRSVKRSLLSPLQARFPKSGFVPGYHFFFLTCLACEMFFSIVFMTSLT